MTYPASLGQAFLFAKPKKIKRHQQTEMHVEQHQVTIKLKLLLNPRDPVDARRKILLNGDWGNHILREVPLIKLLVDSIFMLVENIHSDWPFQA